MNGGGSFHNGVYSEAELTTLDLLRLEKKVKSLRLRSAQ